MTDAEPSVARTRMEMLPLPIVVDADVLHRNIDYCLRKGWNPSLLDSASTDYTLFTGVVLFATARVQEEVESQLEEIAARREVAREDVVGVWNEVFLPRVRFVEISESDVEDPRIEEVRTLHDADAATAALAVLLAPCIVLTDNRKHFAPLGLRDTPTDTIALDAHELSRYYRSANLMMIVPTITGAMAIEGSKKIVSMIGREATALIALVLLGAAVVLWRSEPDGQLRQSAKHLAHGIGPPLTVAATRALDLTDQMSVLAIEPPSSPDSALRFTAKILSTRQTVITTADISRRLRERDYRFTGPQAQATQARRWLLAQACFVEQRRGHWTIGYHADPL